MNAPHRIYHPERPTRGKFKAIIAHVQRVMAKEPGHDKTKLINLWLEPLHFRVNAANALEMFVVDTKTTSSVELTKLTRKAKKLGKIRGEYYFVLDELYWDSAYSGFPWHFSIPQREVAGVLDEEWEKKRLVARQVLWKAQNYLRSKDLTFKGVDDMPTKNLNWYNEAETFIDFTNW